jgi:hypothetical protein
MIIRRAGLCIRSEEVSAAMRYDWRSANRETHYNGLKVWLINGDNVNLGAGLRDDLLKEVIEAVDGKLTIEVKEHA